MVSPSSEAVPVPEHAPAEKQELPVLVIEPRRGPLRIGWGELWRHRELLYFLAWRDIKLRYKQTVFGAAWAMLQPLLTMVIFVAVFGRVTALNAATDGAPYPLYVFVGLLPWTFFANTITNASSSVISSANLVTKVYFPRLVIPLASVGVALVDLMLSCGVLALLMIAYRVAPTWQMLWVPALLLGLIAFSLGVGAILAALNVSYRDFRFVVPFLVQTWLFATPVIYPASVVPERLRWLLWLNPVSGFVDGIRASMLGQTPHPPASLLAFAGALATLVLGVGYFRASERRFADVI